MPCWLHSMFFCKMSSLILHHRPCSLELSSRSLRAVYVPTPWLKLKCEETFIVAASVFDVPLITVFEFKAFNSIGSLVYSFHCFIFIFTLYFYILLYSTLVRSSCKVILHLLLVSPVLFEVDDNVNLPICGHYFFQHPKWRKDWDIRECK